MTTPTPTRHRGVYTVTADALPDLLRSAAVTPTLAVADPALAARLGPPVPPLPPGRFRDAVEAAAAAAAGVPETAVLMVALALIDAAAAALMPPALAAVPMPPTIIVGSPAQTEAVLAAAEAVAASSRGRWRA